MKLLLETHRSRGMTRADVAQTAGGSVPTVRALERGEGSIRSPVGVMAAPDPRFCWVETARISLIHGGGLS